MPSFEIKSELNTHEVANAVDQANRIIQNRFDFKGTGARFNLGEGSISLSSQEEFQLHQMLPILKESLTKRGVDLKCLHLGDVEVSTGNAKQLVTLKEGIDQESGKKIIQLIKSNKLKVQVSMQGESLRVSGKKRDDLQEVIGIVKKEDFNLALQYENFRD
ncbi:MAG: YajQ family cyclic di-GMP-binding protein [Gammaproteobacteria bacterium]